MIDTVTFTTMFSNLTSDSVRPAFSSSAIAVNVGRNALMNI